MMIRKPTLDRAKAFLAWDCFPGLVIQLIGIEKTVSYFFPPFDQGTILLFYERGSDCTLPLLFLFHEAGHFLQYRTYGAGNRLGEFWERVRQPSGVEKQDFERESWKLGKVLFKEFIEKEGLNRDLLVAYDSKAEESVQSYR